MKMMARVFFGALTVLLALCMLFTGCGEKTTPPDNGEGTQNDDGDENKKEISVSEGVESGFYLSDRGCPSPSTYCAYKSEKNEFDIDDVTLQFFFGGNYAASGIEYQLEHGDNYPEFDYYFTNDEGDRIHIKHIEENFVSEKYSCDFVHDEKAKLVEVKYNYSETLTVPKAIFTKEKGLVYFGLYGVNPRGPMLDERCIVATHFYYKLVENKVVLSSKPID